MSKRCSSAELSATWSIPARTLRDILAGLDSSDGYDKDEAAAAVIAHYKGAFDRVDMEAATDRARRSKAEADSAEMDAEKKAKSLCWLRDAEMFWKDGLADITKKIQAIPGISTDQLNAIFVAIRSVQLPEPPPAEP